MIALETLPTCRHRKILGDDRIRCDHSRLVQLGELKPADCQRCATTKYFDQDVPSRPSPAPRKPEKKPVRVVLPPSARLSLPCIHRGAVLEWCNTCASGQKHVYDCDKHERCTVAHDQKKAAASCERCDDFTLATAEALATRHLLYHLMPVAGNGVWRWNVDQLRRRLSLFTGKRIVAVVTGPGLDTPAVVRAAFVKDDVEILAMPNDPGRREVATWSALWSRVKDMPGVTFYSHAKGVTQASHHRGTIRRWSEMMYESLLDYWPTVETMLATRPMVGAFQKLGAGWPEIPAAAWHYTGSFYWCVNSAVAGRLEKIPAHAHGVEMWPGVAFRADDCAGLVLSDAVANLDLYKPETLKRVETEFARWKSTATKSRSVTG